MAIRIHVPGREHPLFPVRKSKALLSFSLQEQYIPVTHQHTYWAAGSRLPLVKRRAQNAKRRELPVLHGDSLVVQAGKGKVLAAVELLAQGAGIGEGKDQRRHGRSFHRLLNRLHRLHAGL